MHFKQLLLQSNSIPELFFKIADSAPEATVYRAPRVGLPHYHAEEFSYERVRGRILKIRRNLLSAGVQAGMKVAIISGSRPEWIEADIAIMSVGAITVSVYPTLTLEETGFILHDSDSRHVFVENEEQLAKIKALTQRAVSIPLHENSDERQEAFLQFMSIHSFEAVSDTLGLPLQVLTYDSETSVNEEFSLPVVSREDLATIVYTSGTTGFPKGVLQSHGNHLANVEQSLESGIFGDDRMLFLFLPLAHSFARLISYLGLLTPASIAFARIADQKSSRLDLSLVAQDIRQCGAQVFPTVPRVLEKMHEGILKKAREPGAEGLILSLALKAGAKMFYLKELDRNLPWWDGVLFSVTEPIRRKLRKKLLGESFTHFISGGAKLNPETNKFFWSIGVEVYEGYGLTETCVATNVNRLGRNKIGSVGPAFRGIEVRIAEDGEILFRGPNITRGYHNRPMATAESYDHDGWFHTGDLGRQDEDGRLYITDRKKELIVTAGGKKVPPQKIETLLLRSSVISQALYYGDGKPYCIALVTLNHDAVTKILSEGEQSIPEKQRIQDVLDQIRDSVNSELASYEAVKKIVWVPGEFSVENGLLTPTLKMKRKSIVAAHQAVLDGAYS